MARQFTQLKSAIWSDRDFCSLPASAQRVYLLAKSQANVSWCGVVPFTEKRWAAMAPDTEPTDIVDAIDVLVARGYVLVDSETEELWVRSWVKHNGVMEQPNLRKAMRAAYETVLSTAIKRAVYDSLPDSEKAQVTTPLEAFGEPFDRPECVGQDLDLDLDLDLAPATTTAAATEPPAPDPVDAETARRIESRRRNGEDIGPKLEALIRGDVIRDLAVRGTSEPARPSPLDEAAAVQRTNFETGLSTLREGMAEANAHIAETTPAERRAFIEANPLRRNAS